MYYDPMYFVLGVPPKEISKEELCLAKARVAAKFNRFEDMISLCRDCFSACAEEHGNTYCEFIDRQLLLAVRTMCPYMKSLPEELIQKLFQLIDQTMAYKQQKLFQLIDQTMAYKHRIVELCDIPENVVKGFMKWSEKTKGDAGKQ